MRKTIFTILLPASLLLSACGSAGNPSGTASKDPGAAGLRFTACMRKAGVDAQADVNGGTRIRVEGNINPSRLERLQRDCSKSSGMPEPKAPSAKMQQEAQDGALKFAACMRAHGVDMPDPKFDGGRITMKIREQDNPSSPRVQKAQQACQKLMPQMRGGPGGGTAGGPDSGKPGGQLSAP